MKNAIKNFITITLAIVLGLILTGFYLRLRALNQPIKMPFDHPFLHALEKRSPAVIAWSGGKNEWPENTMFAFEHAAALDRDLILWVDVRPTKDGTLVAFASRDLATTTNGTGWIAYTSDADLAKLDAGYQFKDLEGKHPYRGQGLKVPLLTDVLKKFADRFLILNFRDYKVGMAENVIRVLEGGRAADRVLIMSPEDGFLRDMREKEPSWIFGTSQAQTTRLLMFADIGMEPLINLSGDIFVSVPEEGSPPYQLSNRIVHELRRRKMKILIGPPLNSSDVNQWQANGVDGIVTANPTDLITRFKR